MTTTIHGHCDPRFEGARQAFGQNFENGLEVGASACAVVDGEVVLDVWAGHADAAGTRPWEEDTIVNVYSTTKAMAALTTLMQVDRGKLDLDAPVASIWPEFGAAGKEGVLVRHLLSHTSGVPGWEQPVDVGAILDWDHSTALLAAQEPWWEPGTKSGYHALNQGHLLGEVVRRVADRSLGSFFREEVAEPLGADFHIGLDESHEPRVAEMVPPVAGLTDQPTEPGSVAERVLGNPGLTGDVANLREWHAGEVPAANGQGNARSVARVAGVVAQGGSAEGVRLLGEDTLARALEEQSYGTDLVLGVPIRFGLGFGLRSEEMPIGQSDSVLFWGGWGGSLVVIDLEARLGFSYVMNRMGEGTLGDVRGGSILLHVYAGLAS
ncbi:MAG: serine hydrolase domain-containing protein [Myxococcota bacterium]|nr:serine hydrolase domain-containing protein [Myxococcota bacterium]